MPQAEKLYHLTGSAFRMPYGIDSGAMVLTMRADSIPLLSWPNGRPCTEANLYMLCCFEKGLSRRDGGGTLTQYAKLLSHLIRFCFKNRCPFIDLTDAQFSLFIRTLQGETHANKMGQQKRQPSHVITIGRICLGFLAYVGEIYSDAAFVGPAGTIRAESKKFTLANKGKPIVRYYWHHHAFPNPEPLTCRLPIATVDIAKLIAVIPAISSTTYQRRRRFVLIKLLEITGARRVEVANIKVGDIYDALSMRGNCLLKVLTAKKKGGREAHRYLPVSRVDLELLANFIEKFRHRVVRKTIGEMGDAGYLLISETTGNRLATETLTNEILLLAKAANIEEQACAHMFRHRFITKLFVALIEQHELKNQDDFRRALLDTETLKKKVQEYTGHTAIGSLEPYIHLAFEEVARFGKAINLIKAKVAVESLQSNLKDALVELQQGKNPTEMTGLLVRYINATLEDLEGAWDV